MFTISATQRVYALVRAAGVSDEDRCALLGHATRSMSGHYASGDLGRLLLVAEEMDLDWAKVRVLQVPAEAKGYGNPLFGGAMLTGGSRTTRGYYDILRLAGHQAREVMRINAARYWGVPLAEVSTVPHHAVHGPTARRLSYGAIAVFAEVPANLAASTKEQLKPASAFRLIGKDLPRIDVPEKVNGTATHGIDVALPGMQFGSVLRAPVQGESPSAVDDTETLKVAGVTKVVRLRTGWRWWRTTIGPR